MLKLGVNIDHIATLRQVRLAKEPDPIKAAIIALDSGADGITAHLREDRRHIQDKDIRMLCRHARPLNMEMAITKEMLSIACSLKPESCCLVPEKRQELTTEGGLDVLSDIERVKKAV
ncbi:MAG TPA: pyridoxine 5'-phosphate synthase, partial [Victivallales bacterium]|nr:pyridoxine 5'-phosphate synthase [Victivallales bacterium]